jgi:hypothetical protein
MHEAGRRIVQLLALSAAAVSAQPLEETSAAVQFSGHYKNMLLGSRAADGAQERYTLDASRLRLEWTGQVRAGVGIEIHYDHELLLGDLRTPQFLVEPALPRRTYWDLERVYARGDDVLARHRLRRGAVTLSRGATDLRLGRQRVAWGTGRFWSPLDLLNPLSPTALEPGEREGVDAVLVEHKRSAVSRVSAVFAPIRGDRDHVLARWQDNVHGTDYSITAGRGPQGRVLGVDAAGQIGGAGVRAEWTLTRDRGGRTPHRVLLGWDYAFANTLTLSAELYFDGTGSSDPSRHDVAGLLSGRRQTLGRRYAGLHARYEFTPLLKWESWWAANLDDRSAYFSPRISYSVRENLDVAIGAQLYAGRRGTEFGQRRNLRFAYLQWFF